MTEKRLQGVSVTGQMVAAAFPVGTIPASSRFMHAYFDYERNVFVCVFENETFQPVPEGCPIPIDVDNLRRQTITLEADAINTVKQYANSTNM